MGTSGMKRDAVVCEVPAGFEDAARQAAAQIRSRYGIEVAEAAGSVLLVCTSADEGRARLVWKAAFAGEVEHARGVSIRAGVEQALFG